MLTRLKVHGFKNLVDVDVLFGPFTCIACANGVGKSNLFDAITFLSLLSDQPLMEAAKSVRDERNCATDVRSLFLQHGDKQLDEMLFAAEMLVPATGKDDLGQLATASITFLRYSLVLRYCSDRDAPSGEQIAIIKEELAYINKSESHKSLHFPNSPTWRESVVQGKGRRGQPFLSTEGGREEKASVSDSSPERGGTGEDHGDRLIKIHQDGRSGNPRRYLASNLPRTVLSSTNAVESPTALLARLEMRSWRLLQLEPSSLRNADPFSAPAHVGVDGSHLPSTLHHLARRETPNGNGQGQKPAVFARVANRLSSLVENVREIRVDEDRQRELLTLQVIDRDQNSHAARALSDGTLRFLALAVLEQDPARRGFYASKNRRMASIRDAFRRC